MTKRQFWVCPDFNALVDAHYDVEEQAVRALDLNRKSLARLRNMLPMMRGTIKKHLRYYASKHPLPKGLDAYIKDIRDHFSESEIDDLFGLDDASQSSVIKAKVKP